MDNALDGDRDRVVSAAPLAATERVLARYAEDDGRRWLHRSARVDGEVRTILRHGSAADAAVLLPAFLADPEGRPHLLPVLAEHGDGAAAERLVAACVDGARLRPGVPVEVLHVVGYLGHEPATTLLWEHARQPDDWAAQRAAALGLVHLPCTGLAATIDAALTVHRRRSLFPEFLPVLAGKAGDAGWAAKLHDWGSRGASTDCNAGLLLGLALIGDGGLFADALWSPHWETYASATGTAVAAYAGTRVLGWDTATLHT